MRWFDPQLMSAEHWHGHIEFNWLAEGSMDYRFDGRPVTLPAGRMVVFWAGIPHQTVQIDRGPSGAGRQCNIYLPLDVFLYMPNLGALTETMMGGGVIALPDDAADSGLLQCWYTDYRSGDAERVDILKSEIANMLRRTAMVGWDVLLPPWIENRRRAPAPYPPCAMWWPWFGTSWKISRRLCAPPISRKSSGSIPTTP